MKQKLKRLGCALSGLISALVFNPFTAFAGEGETVADYVEDAGTGVYDISWINKSSNGAFNSLIHTMQGYGASGWNVVKTVFIFVTVCGAGLAFIRLQGNNAQKKELAKDRIFWIAVSAFGVGASVTIITFLMNQGASLSLS